MPERLYSTPFDPRRNEPCFCGSGRRFRHCCGSIAADRDPPHGVIVRRGWLDSRLCDDLVAFLEPQPWQWCTTTKESGGEQLDKARVTQTTEFREKQPIVDDWVRKAMIEVAEPGLKMPVEWFIKPHILRYSPGGFYRMHADSEHFDDAADRWYKVWDRDVSLLLYINDDYEGGEVLFKLFNYRFRPGKGDLVVFPSDHRYMHAACPVKAGTRYAIVTWAARGGQPRLMPPLEEGLEVQVRP